MESTKSLLVRNELAFVKLATAIERTANVGCLKSMKKLQLHLQTFDSADKHLNYEALKHKDRRLHHLAGGEQV
jgi:hypothetical protein